VFLAEAAFGWEDGRHVRATDTRRTVGEIMTTDVLVVTIGSDVAEVARSMLQGAAAGHPHRRRHPKRQPELQPGPTAARHDNPPRPDALHQPPAAQRIPRAGRLDPFPRHRAKR
jgi:CBS domain-containing protein